ncbi:hypothetical protein TIFTF001_046496 [Ficus carica]|uniref:Uncharacterized protein n=1 Tax=Ficus carica TaxID=3494 RepID=A0AA88CVE0_FICCA|nr:hypothetical protein TIFTF001_046496 [Ficus carica]
MLKGRFLVDASLKIIPFLLLVNAEIGLYLDGGATNALQLEMSSTTGIPSVETIHAFFCANESRA